MFTDDQIFDRDSYTNNDPKPIKSDNRACGACHAGANKNPKKGPNLIALCAILLVALAVIVNLVL